MADKTVNYTQSVGASARIPNILAGTILETAPGFGYYHIFGSHEAAVGTLEVSVNVAGEMQAQRLTMNAKATAPIKPDDHLTSVKVAPGFRVLMELEETAGAATVPNIRTEYEELSIGQLAQMVASRG